ncbi:porin [Pendulispora albinea]|uniref:Porin n=1 Tax=Pendulispora albinea TaxID=2741071 RepID=A0ABZ2M1I0_9BACT
MSLTAAHQAAAQEPAPPSTSSPTTTPGASWSTAPTSSSGSDVGTQPAQPTAAAPASGDVEGRVKALEAKLAGMQEKEEKRSKVLEWLEHVKLSGWIQPQLIWQSYNDAASPNAGAGGASGLPAGIGANTTIAKADGTTTNPDMFRIRRARLKFELTANEYAKVIIEIDPFPTGGLQGAGTGTIGRQVEAVATIPWSKDVKTEIGMGIMKLPFGYSILQSDADRPFIERNWYEQNMTPGEFDVGVRAATTALDKKLSVVAAVFNGVTQGEKNFTVLPDVNRGKDVVGRAAYNFGPFDVGVSGIFGHAAVVDATALKFKQYKRWGVNFEAAVHHKFVKSLGNTKVFAELVLAQNLDRGTKYAFALPTIPANINDDVGSHDERGLMVRLEQDLTDWFTLGFRYDMYTPDSAQKNNARDTYGFLGSVNFAKGLKLLLEFDHAIDNVHRPGSAAPSKQIETFSSVLQARF